MNMVTLEHCPLVLRTGICADLRKEVLHGNLDLAFTLEEVGHDDGQVFEVLLRERMLLLGRHGHPLAKSHQVCASVLEGETILVTEPCLRTHWRSQD